MSSGILSRLSAGALPQTDELADFIENLRHTGRKELYETSLRIRQRIFGNRVLFRGLIEFTSYCRNDCYYCGLRRSNTHARRYRLSKNQILECCRLGFDLGFRSFVLQGGEDKWFTDERLTDIIASIHAHYPEAAITLSFGEQSRESYRRYFSAGANRYLLRHESADSIHYGSLHPNGMSIEKRVQCLNALKEIGYQVGAGFMVGSPGQTPVHLAEDLLFLHKFQPHMIGIGPFIPHKETPFAQERTGSAERTLDILALTRILLPQALLPATTALGSIHPSGREQALRSAANVIMPNLSPSNVRSFYSIYDGKRSTGSEGAESLARIRDALAAAGLEADLSRGDWGCSENS